MPSSFNVTDLLADIIENAERIAEYTASMDRDTFAANGLVRDAVERCLERVCEASHRLGNTATILVPNQPWADIRGMGTVCGTHTIASASMSCGMLCSTTFLTWLLT